MPFHKQLLVAGETVEPGAPPWPVEAQWRRGDTDAEDSEEEIFDDEAGQVRHPVRPWNAQTSLVSLNFQVAELGCWS